MTDKKQTRETILAAVRDALGRDDLVTVERIMARLSDTRIEAVIMDAVNHAIDAANETELYFAEHFAKTQRELRDRKKQANERTNKLLRD